MIARGLDRLAALNATLTARLRAFAGLLLALMLTVAMAQVVSRYVLGSSISWSEEVSKSLMVWSVFVAAPAAYRGGSNVAIELVRSSFGPRGQALVRFISHLLVLWLFGRLFWESLLLVDRGWSIRAASVPVQMGYVYLVVPVSFGAMLLVSIELAASELREFRSPSPAASRTEG